jgi:hypothetical protein
MDLKLATMSEAEAATVVEELLAELVAVRSEVSRLERLAVGLRKMVDAVVEVHPSVEDLLPDDLDEDEEPRPRGAEAVRRVLEMNRGVWFEVPKIVSLLDQQGWLPDSSNPANAARTALERLVESEVVVKARSTKGTVIYRVGTDADSKPPDPIYGDEEPF